MSNLAPSVLGYSTWTRIICHPPRGSLVRRTLSRLNPDRPSGRNVPFISVADVPRTHLKCGTECNEALGDVPREDERAGQTAQELPQAVPGAFARPRGAA